MNFRDMDHLGLIVPTLFHPWIFLPSGVTPSLIFPPDRFRGIMDELWTLHVFCLFAGNIMVCLWDALGWYHRYFSHYSDVIMGVMASQITSPTIVTQLFVQVQIKENIKAPRHWSLWGEFTVELRIPLTKSQWRRKCVHLVTPSCAATGTTIPDDVASCF